MAAKDEPQGWYPTGPPDPQGRILWACSKCGAMVPRTSMPVQGTCACQAVLRVPAGLPTAALKQEYMAQPLPLQAEPSPAVPWWAEQARWFSGWERVGRAPAPQGRGTTATTHRCGACRSLIETKTSVFAVPNAGSRLVEELPLQCPHCGRWDVSREHEALAKQLVVKLAAAADQDPVKAAIDGELAALGIEDASVVVDAMGAQLKLIDTATQATLATILFSELVQARSQQDVQQLVVAKLKAAAGVLVATSDGAPVVLYTNEGQRVAHVPNRYAEPPEAIAFTNGSVIRTNGGTAGALRMLPEVVHQSEAPVLRVEPVQAAGGLMAPGTRVVVKAGLWERLEAGERLEGIDSSYPWDQPELRFGTITKVVRLSTFGTVYVVAHEYHRPPHSRTDGRLYTQTWNPPAVESWTEWCAARRAASCRVCLDTQWMGAWPGGGVCTTCKGKFDMDAAYGGSIDEFAKALRKARR